MHKYLKTILSLTVICVVTAVLLAVVNSITSPIIKKQEEAAANSALLVVMPNGEGFEKVNLENYELPKTVTEAYSEKNGGYVFKMETAGYASGLVIMCGVDGNGVVTGATYIVSNETNKAETTYGNNFVGKDTKTVDEVDTVGGSTKTTAAYKGAIKDALNSFVILNGGSVDLRSEEEILAENLNTALGSAEGKFTEEFITEEINSSAVYKAENGSGYVFVVGETFVGVGADGAVLTETDETLKQQVEQDAQKHINSVLTEINISKYSSMPTNILKAYKTNGGNYVFEIRAAGYGINGGNEWHPASGEYIYIKVSVTGSGKIISCVTTAQSETENIGSACADPSFYTQFNSKTESDYMNIDAIGGATITTNGYRDAIGKVFEAVKILKGGA